ncbi:MAG TPA: multiubiquitin domain-containing protein [Bacteroidales bacterium]
MIKDNKEHSDGHGENTLRLTINGKMYDWPHQYITGAELRNLGNVPKEHDIYLAIKKPWEDEKIEDHDKVDLARPEIEHFFSKGQGIKVIICTAQGDWETEFLKTVKIAEVIEAVKSHFGFAQNGKYELRLSSNPNESLKPERTLVSYGIKDGDKLIFTDLGNAAQK